MARTRKQREKIQAAQRRSISAPLAEGNEGEAQKQTRRALVAANKAKRAKRKPKAKPKKKPAPGNIPGGLFKLRETIQKRRRKFE